MGQNTEQAKIALRNFLDFSKMPSLKGSGELNRQFATKLFKLWASGTSFLELVDMFEGTPYAFSFDQIKGLAHVRRWEDQKKAVLQEAYETLKVHTVVVKAEKIKVLNRLNNLVLQDLEEEYREWVATGKNPKKKPSWLPHTTKDLDLWFKLHDFIASGGHEAAKKVEVKNIDAKEDIPIEDLSDEEVSMLLKALVDKRNNVIDVTESSRELEKQIVNE